MVAMIITRLSGQRLRLSAATIPSGTPSAMTQISASAPTRAVTGRPSAIIWLTLMPGYLNDGPKSKVTMPLR